MKYLVSVILLTIVASASAQMAESAKDKAFELRQRKYLEYYAAIDGQRSGFFQIAARVGLNRDIERCREDFSALLDTPSGDMFYTMPMMAAYLHGREYWTPEIHEKARNVWKTYLPYRGDTENHWVMWHTALLLAAQTWPDLPESEWANGRTSQENYDDANGFLNFWFETTSTIGQGEFDSPDYINVYVGSLFALYDFATDPVLKQRVEMALHWLLADYAVDYLQGAYTGGHSRIYERAIINPLRDNAVGFAYLFFGDIPLPRDASFGFPTLAALTSYRLPDIIRRIATDRSQPYVATERKRVRNLIRYRENEKMNPPVYKYNYMTKNFSLGCLDGGLQQPIQIHTWSVTYPYDFGKVDNLFALHPYYSDIELGMFFPEKLKVMTAEVVKSKGTYNKEDKWTGGSPYERTFQHENTIIVLYDLDENTHFKHINYYFPKSLSTKEEQNSGWIFAVGGAAYIAVRPFKPGTWNEEASCDRFRSPHLKNGLVTVAADSSDYSSWQDFKNKILQTDPDLSKLDSDVEVNYTTISGDEMTFRFPDHRQLNGKKLDLTDSPLFAGPFLNGNDRVLRMTHGGEELVVDFKNDEIIKRLHD
jgi:hypothetical protein